MDINLCICGCNEEIPFKPHHKYKKPRYLRGHQPHWATYTPDPSEIPSGICECGCGKPTHIAKATYRDRRHFKGHPVPFLQGHSLTPTGPDHHLWKGGRWTHKSGYVYVYAPDHPKANRDRYVLEHRLVMEQTIGRLLRDDEVVHHINHVKDDNRPENLMILSPGEHSTLHAPDRQYDSETMSKAGKKGAAARWSG